ncbi:MAG: hypothetical protein J6X58_06345 [Bacteroidales bacterium]|nr:hypothetical protein [Bacteroidales bacterium]
MPDTTLELPLFVVTDKELQDSISSAISQLEKNWNYNETYGYIFVLLFATFDNPDTMTISINPYSIRNLFPLATFRHLEYLKTIGCIRINGYIFLVDAYTWVSREEIYYYIKHTKESIKFELNTCGSIKPFAPMPFNRLVFSVHLQDNKKFIAPNDWDKYKDKVND